MLSCMFELSFSFFKKGPQTELQSRMEHVDLHPDDDDECIPKLPEFFQDPPSPTYDTPSTAIRSISNNKTTSFILKQAIIPFTCLCGTHTPGEVPTKAAPFICLCRTPFAL